MAKNDPERDNRRRAETQTTPATPSAGCEGVESRIQPEWIRLPGPGERCPWTGLSRSSLNDLIFADPPKIRSVVLKKPGASRGIRLLHWPSIRSFLHALMEQQHPGATDHEEEVVDD